MTVSHIPLVEISTTPPQDSRPLRLWSSHAGRVLERDDRVAVEEPLEMHVDGAAPVITMRTPGHDRELTAGLLLSEGLVQQREDIEVVEHLPGRDDKVHVRLRSFSETKGARLRRSSLSNSACGVCGKERLNLDLLDALPPLSAGPTVPARLLAGLPARLRAAQSVFDQTGGLHAAALFDAAGELQALREDVGRHNALDKLTGWALLNDRLPLHDHMVLLSGRASFELLQKCLMARVPMVCAVSAPSSFAVDLASRFDVTLVGFLRRDRFNVYSAPERIRWP